MAKKEPLITIGEVGVIALIIASIGAAYVLSKGIEQAVKSADCCPCNT